MSSIDAGSFQEYLKNPLLFPDTFKSWLNDFVATNIPKLHVSQVYGFKLQSIKQATEITGIETVSASAYTSFSVDGPTFDHIPNGFYLLFFGATYGTTAGGPVYNGPTGDPVYIAPVYDGSTPNDGEACLLNAGTNGRVVLLDLTSSAVDNHTITFKYKVAPNAVNSGIWNRWAFLLKVVTDQ